MFKTIEAPKDGVAALPKTTKYHGLYIIRNHIHVDIKAEYLMEEDLRALWLALQTRYEQQKAVILLEATHEWTIFAYRILKSVGEFNHVMHISSKLKFYEKKPSDAEKIKREMF